jgi:hypothetical protein
MGEEVLPVTPPEPKKRGRPPGVKTKPAVPEPKVAKKPVAKMKLPSEVTGLAGEAPFQIATMVYAARTKRRLPIDPGLRQAAVEASRITLGVDVEVPAWAAWLLCTVVGILGAILSDQLLKKMEDPKVRAGLEAAMKAGMIPDGVIPKVPVGDSLHQTDAGKDFSRASS